MDLNSLSLDDSLLTDVQRLIAEARQRAGVAARSMRAREEAKRRGGPCTRLQVPEVSERQQVTKQRPASSSLGAVFVGGFQVRPVVTSALHRLNVCRKNAQRRL